jgi:parallel beta-helix repeat protein
MLSSRPLRPRSIGAALATVAALLTSGAVAANVAPLGRHIYYVAPDGSDQAAGTGLGSAWASIQHALDAAPAGATIFLAAGSYSPFTINKARQSVLGPESRRAIIGGDARHTDVVAIRGTGDTVANLTVAHCVPTPSPAGSFEYQGSAGIAIHPGANNATVSASTIRDGTGINSDGLPFGCFGIAARNADGAILSGNDIQHNGYGIFVAGGGRNDRIDGNAIHDNNVVIRNTPFPASDDFGAVGIGFYNLAPSSVLEASHNRITHNVGPSSDFGTDGGGFEVYNAGGISMLSNTLADNDVAVETGGGAGASCAGNVFARNTVTGRLAGSKLTRSPGMILRCAQQMKIFSNRFSYLDWWTFDVTLRPDLVKGLDKMSIYDNTITQRDDLVFSLQASPQHAGYHIGRNSYSYHADFARGWTGLVLGRPEVSALSGKLG